MNICPVCVPGASGDNDLCDAHGFTSARVLLQQEQSPARDEETALVRCETPQTIDVDDSLYDELSRAELVAFVRSAINGGGRE